MTGKQTSTSNMDYMGILNSFNNVPKEDKPSIIQQIQPEVTFVMTMCGRVDLMEKTLDSFMRFNRYPIKRWIITEDSNDPAVHKQCNDLNQSKYKNKLEFIFNSPKEGQVRSIDKAYKLVDTEYVFHCEEDWEFYRAGFIEQSMKVLSNDQTILQAWIRPKNDRILNKISDQIQTIDGIRVRPVLPASFMVKGAGPMKSNLVIKDYMGFSWNPGLKRMSDYRLLNNGYTGVGVEHMIDAFYRDHKKGFRVVSISENDDFGFVKHIGWDRRAGDPKFGIENTIEIEEAKKRAAAEAEARKKAQAEIDSKKNQPVETPKPAGPKLERFPIISVVMQTFLGDYPGSRSNAIEKFHRAVQSFIKQSYQRSELIIVSDGCEITQREYNQHYKQDKRIKYVYVDKDAPDMYTKVNEEGHRYFRGVPRKIGAAMAQGELITYMDSDDILKQHALAKLLIEFNRNPNAKIFINRSWYDHINVLGFPNIVGVGISLEPHVGKPTVRIEDMNLNQIFVESRVSEGYVVMSPWLLMHVSDCKTKWRDTVGDSEDVDFNRRLRQEFPGMHHVFNEPIYVRCHYNGIWDV